MGDRQDAAITPNVVAESNSGLAHFARHEGFADLRTSCGRTLVEPRIFDMDERPVTCRPCREGSGSTTPPPNGDQS